jgi:hypothetical protein
VFAGWDKDDVSYRFKTMVLLSWRSFTSITNLLRTIVMNGYSVLSINVYVSIGIIM